MKKLLILMGLATILIFTGCDNPTGGGDNSLLYKIGDTGPSGVGIVFYVTDGGLHGLEAAPEDQSTDIIWALSDYQYVSLPDGNLPREIGKGSSNTEKIIEQNGEGITYAAGIAQAYDGGGYSDWYLPSEKELSKLYTNRLIVGGFSNDTYWSSSDEKNYISGEYHYNAFVLNFSIGVFGGTNKGNLNRVRAVRSF